MDGERSTTDRTVYKCRSCRTSLFECDVLVNAHGESVSSDTMSELQCGDEGVCYFRGDSTLLPWIERLVIEADWLKGKLVCPKCRHRLGSFDFVSGRQCRCKACVLPPIHVVKSKVDCEIRCHPPNTIENVE